jgi:hypothetical protein
VVSVGEDEEHVLKQRKVVRLEEPIARRRSRRNHIVDQLDADGQSEVTDVAHRVLRSPDDGVHDELELRGGDLEERVEAVEVGDAEELEECDAVSVWRGRGR